VKNALKEVAALCGVEVEKDEVIYKTVSE